MIRKWYKKHVYLRINLFFASFENEPLTALAGDIEKVDATHALCKLFIPYYHCNCNLNCAPQNFPAMFYGKFPCRNLIGYVVKILIGNTIYVYKKSRLRSSGLITLLLSIYSPGCERVVKG